MYLKYQIVYHKIGVTESARNWQ